MDFKGPKERVIEVLKGGIDHNFKDLNVGEKHIEKLLSSAPEGKGDYGFPCFNLGRRIGKNPEEVAEILKKSIEKRYNLRIIENIKNEGGYINFYIDWNHIFNIFLKYNDFPLPKKGKDEKVLVEFSSPNPNKPMHLGHLRNNAIGESISRLLEKNGYKVVRINLINDKGLSIFQTVLAYIKYGNNTEPEKEKPDHFVGRYYLLYKQKEKENPELEEEARQIMRDWEKGDKTIRDVWKKIVGWAMKGFNETYKKLDIKFDRVDYESEIYKEGKVLVKNALKKGLFKTGTSGEVIAPLEKFGLPDKVVLRKDGTPLYITQDIYLAIKRYREEEFEKMIYVVAREQELHFKQLFAILKLLGYEWYSKLYHLSYGMILLEGGKMKSREGKTVDADDIIKEMETLAEREILKRKKEINKEKLKEKSRKIGNAALNFYLLKFDPRKDFVFKPEEGIKFEGETGPYLQYTFARLRSIIKKSNLDIEEIKKNVKSIELNEEEKRIVKYLWFVRDSIINAAERLDPSLVCYSLINLCQKINTYYHSFNILKIKEERLKMEKLVFIDVISKLLEKGMKLIMVDPLEEM